MSTPSHEHTITWTHHHMNTSSHEHIITWAHHLSTSHEHTSHEHIITWARHHMNTPSHEHIITWARHHLSTSSHEHIITWTRHHMSTSSHEHIITILSAHHLSTPSLEHTITWAHHHHLECTSFEHTITWTHHHMSTSSPSLEHTSLEHTVALCTSITSWSRLHLCFQNFHGPLYSMGMVVSKFHNNSLQSWWGWACFEWWVCFLVQPGVCCSSEPSALPAHSHSDHWGLSLCTYHLITCHIITTTTMPTILSVSLRLAYTGRLPGDFFSGDLSQL